MGVNFHFTLWYPRILCFHSLCLIFVNFINLLEEFSELWHQMPVRVMNSAHNLSLLQWLFFLWISGWSFIKWSQQRRMLPMVPFITLLYEDDWLISSSTHRHWFYCQNWYLASNLGNCTNIPHSFYPPWNKQFFRHYKLIPSRLQTSDTGYTYVNCLRILKLAVSSLQSSMCSFRGRFTVIFLARTSVWNATSLSFSF